MDTGMHLLLWTRGHIPSTPIRCLAFWLPWRMGVGKILPGIHTFISPWSQGPCGPRLCHSRSVLQTPLKFGEAEVFLCLLNLGCSLVPIEMPMYPKYCFSQPSDHHPWPADSWSPALSWPRSQFTPTLSAPLPLMSLPLPGLKAKQERENDDCVCLLCSPVLFPQQIPTTFEDKMGQSLHTA